MLGVSIKGGWEWGGEELSDVITYHFSQQQITVAVFVVRSYFVSPGNAFLYPHSKFKKRRYLYRVIYISTTKL